MRTQNIQMNLTQKQLDPILFRTEETGREIEFTLLDPDGTAYDLTDYDLKFSMLKPDGNFIYQDLSGGILTQTEQMTTSRGIGYYAIRVSDQDTLIYTGQGKVVIDDHVITDETLESISEVDGLVFPDDFLTIDDHVAVIDDDVTSTDKTWSSAKISDEIENVSVIVSKTAEGNPIELTDAADAALVKCVTVITGYQSGTGTPSPDNIRPITAYTEGEIEVRGKNILDRTNDVNGYSMSQSGATTVNADMCYSALHHVEAGRTYTFSGISAVMAYRGVIGFDASGNYVVGCGATSSQIAVGNLYSITFTVPNGVTQIRASFGINDTKAQIEKGSSVTDYEPYVGTTHTTTYPSAIYRGSEDVVNGEIVAEWGMIASYAGESLSGEWISDRDVYAPDTTPTTGAQVAYALATPTTSSVTPTNLPIKSLSGYTHIESSTGYMEIEYITEDYQPLVESIVMESESITTKLWDAGFTPSPGVWLEYDFGEDLEDYDAIVILFVVSGWEGNNADSVTVYPKMQQLNTNKYYHYIKGTDYGIQFWRVSGTTYGLGAIDGNYPPQYKAVYGIKY